MKKFNFSKLLMAVALTASLLMLGGCQPEVKTEYEQTLLVGDWISQHNEKYSISYTDYDNYSHYDSSYTYHADTWYLYYSTNSLVVKPISKTAGYIYGKFDDNEHKGYGATLGQWYALYYDNLTTKTVSFYQPYKDGGKAGCDTLEEAISEYTIANNYYDFSRPSECTKQ